MAGSIYNWNISFQQIAPLMAGHCDYLEMHNYNYNDLLTAALQYYGNGGDNAWQAWEDDLYNFLVTQASYAAASGFDIDHIGMQEFGAYRGYNPQTGETSTDQDVANYITHYYNALNRAGWKRASYFAAFGIGANTYDVIVANGDNTATILSGYNQIATAYSGTPPPKIHFADKDWTIRNGDWNVS